MLNAREMQARSAEVRRAKRELRLNDEAVERIAAAAPTLTPEQRERLTAIFGGVR